MWNAVAIAVVAAAAAPSVEVSVSPKGVADVIIEGEWGTAGGKTGTPISIKPGIAVIRVTRPGYWDGWANVKVGKSGKKRLRIAQKPGVPLGQFQPVGAVFFSKSGSWQRGRKTPYKIVGKDVFASGELPGEHAGCNMTMPLADAYVASATMYTDGPIAPVYLFGQKIDKPNGAVSVTVIVIGKKEYVSVNGGRFKKASLVKNQFSAHYPRGAIAAIRITRIQMKTLSDDEVTYLGRVYKL